MYFPLNSGRMSLLVVGHEMFQLSHGPFEVIMEPITQLVRFMWTNTGRPVRHMGDQNHTRYQ